MTLPRKSRVGKPPRPEPTATTSVFGDEVVVYCERTERMHCFDRSASLVWALCDGSRDVEMIVDEAATLVGLSPDEVRAEIELALMQFRELGIIR